MSAAGAVGLLQSPTRAATRATDEFKYGESRIGISDNERDGTLYVPKSYKPGVPMPVMMMLHGFL